MSRDDVTVRDLVALGKIQRDKPYSIVAWKIKTKAFAEKYGLTDREAVDLAEVAGERF